MATGSEELSSQAEHLRETIAFFKIDKTGNASQRKSTTAKSRGNSFGNKPVTNLKKGIALDMSMATTNHADAMDSAYEKY